MAPAQAATSPASAMAVTTHQQASPASERPCGPGANLRAVTRCAPGPQQFSEGGCGFLQRCVYLSRTEQQYLVTGAKWIVQAALCAAGLGIGCVVAGVIVELAARWLDSRGGICPVSKPKLRVQWFPTVGVEGCVS
jgi:hypothetical protein